MIDHRTTSRDHPQADGLAEHMVQTVKRGLRKYSLNKGHHGDWDLQLPWIAMGNRFSKHASLASFSPYYLLFGRHPVLSKAIQADADTVLANMDNPDTWALVRWHWRISPLLNIETICAMQRFVEEVIDHRCVGFDLGTTFICNKQLQLP
jgi:hypothetical protein